MRQGEYEMAVDSACEHDLTDFEHAPGVDESSRSTHLEVTIYQAAVYSC